MGDRNRAEVWADNEKPVHRVCVDDFYLASHEVSQEQWRMVMGGKNPSRFPLCTSCPVENISRRRMLEFLARFSSENSRVFRLPTEAEWEYAARSGGMEHTWAGTSHESDIGEYVWYERNSRGRTHPVGQKWRNRLDLYDMSGNVWELCSDYYDAAYYWSSPQVNPKGPEKGKSFVLRGGDWASDEDEIRASARGDSAVLLKRGASIGFRVAFTP